MPSIAKVRSRIAAFAPLLPALGAGGAAVAIAWRRWIDPLADSGREFDVPARVAAGERLLHEISSYYYGPLWPWAGGLSVRLFGRSFSTLEVPAGAAAIAIIVGLYVTIRRSAGALPAAIASALAATISLAAFSPAALMFPYSVSNTLALAAGFLALATIGRPRGAPAAAAGLAGVMLSRPELGFVLAGAAVVAGVRASDRDLRRRFVVPAVSAAVVATVIYAVEFRGIPFSRLLTISPLVLHSPLPVIRRFYLENAGFLDPAGSVRTLGRSVVIVGAGLAALAAVSSPRFLPRFSRSGRLAAFAAVAVALTVIRIATLSRPGETPTSLIFVAAPLVCTVALVRLLLRPLRTEELIPFLVIAFAVATSFRVFFRIRLGWITTYSAFAFPPLCAAIVILLLGPWKPPGIDRALLGRALAIVAACVILVHLARLSRYRRSFWGAFIETPAGKVWIRGDRIENYECIFDELATRAEPEDSLSAFPESGFFNFVTGLRSPLGEDLVVPGILRPDDEAALAIQIEDAGPRFIILANRPTPEYEQKAFGIDYAAPIAAAIQRRYSVARNCGAGPANAPVGSPDFFLRLYERNVDGNHPSAGN